MISYNLFDSCQFKLEPYILLSSIQSWQVEKAKFQIYNPSTNLSR